jgi:hypothetical protein
MVVVMPATLKQCDLFALHMIDQAVLFIDPTRPDLLSAISERFRFSQAQDRMSPDIRNKHVDFRHYSRIVM